MSLRRSFERPPSLCHLCTKLWGKLWSAFRLAQPVTCQTFSRSWRQLKHTYTKWLNSCNPGNLNLSKLVFVLLGVLVATLSWVAILKSRPWSIINSHCWLLLDLNQSQKLNRQKTLFCGTGNNKNYYWMHLTPPFLQRAEGSMHCSHHPLNFKLTTILWGRLRDCEWHKAPMWAL